MTVVRKNDINYFPQGSKSAWAIPAGGYFQPLHSSYMYVAGSYPIDGSIIGTNVEDPSDTISIPQHTPVKHFKIF